jgi:hypothetical protein
MPLRLRKDALIMLLTLPVIMASALPVGPEGTTPQDYFDLSEVAYRGGDTLSFLEGAKQAVRLAPENPRYMLALARAYALRGSHAEAVRWLARTASMGFIFTAKNSESQPNEDHDLSSLEGSDDYRAILGEIRAINKPVLNSDIAFEVHEKDLMPEGLAYDPVESAFYLGSIHKRKIIKIDKFGHVEDFAKEMQDGLWSVVGMKVDAKRRVLWVNSSALQKMKGSAKERLGSAGLFKYDLETGRLAKKYLIGNRPLHLFNDLAVNAQGDVFVTDSLLGAIYFVSHDQDKLELFVGPERFSFPNGIALSDDDRFLFVSHAEGMSIIDTHKRSCLALSHPPEICLSLIDGLAFYRGSLVAVQNGFRPERLVRFFLNEELNRVEGVRILEANNSRFHFPTTGVVVGDEFYYIANSQLMSDLPDQETLATDQFDSVLVMKVGL